MPKNLKRNKVPLGKDITPVLLKARKRVIIQATLTMLVVVLTIVLMFAMSAAWYTNIVHTNGLTFQVEAWGFDGEITSHNEPIVAGPGDEGLITLEVDSASDSISAVSVGIRKNKLDQEMQKRLYFYVDQQLVRNGELMDRVYVSGQESFTYRLFSQGKLTLTETVHNDSLLKWQWVYDVLGYYVYGYALADGQEIVVQEYLRPIEYDYDKATMAFDAESGEYVMKTVDGTMTMEEFLVNVSLSDGYPGQIDPEQKTIWGYYPVAVDANGRGVYAYLCSYTEIELATQYDTLLGQDANKPEEERVYPQKYEVTLNVSAQKDKYTVVNVTSLASLQTALEYGAANVVTLTGDITIGTGEALNIPTGKTVMIDLNGHKLIASGKDVPVNAGEGSSLTMVNGSIVRGETGTATYGLKSVGAEVVLSGVEISGFYRGIHVSDSEGVLGMDTSMRIVSSRIIGDDCGILVYGNGDKSSQKTQLIVEKSYVFSNDITICGSGNTYNFGTDIQIIESEIVSNPEKEASAIYQPQRDGQLTVYQSHLWGYTGIALKGGTADIVGSEVEGLGARIDPEKFEGSGFNGTGDAIYIETNYNYEIELNIRDLILTDADGNVTGEIPSVFNGKYGYALRVYEPDVTHVKINIVSGEFNRIFDSARFETYVNKGSVAAVKEISDGYQIIVNPISNDGT